MFLHQHPIRDLFNYRMLELTIDQKAIATTVLANVLLSISVQVQKYTKKQIVNLALHGLSSAALKRLWQLGFAMMVIAECAYFISFGVGSGSMQMPSLAAFTAISNVVLPPLYHENHKHAVTGSLMCQLSILILIVTGPYVELKPSQFDWDKGLVKCAMVLEILLGFACIVTRAYKPANCSLKLIANCGITSLMGSHVVTSLKIAQTTSSEDWQGVLWAVVITSFILELVLLSETLEYFSAFQAVPHHFALFAFLTFVNCIVIFDEISNVNTATAALAFLAYCLMVAGVWVAAVPHLDVPVNLAETGLLPKLEERVQSRCIQTLQHQSQSLSLPNEAWPPFDRDRFLETPTGRAILENEFRLLKHQSMVEEQGFF